MTEQHQAIPQPSAAATQSAPARPRYFALLPAAGVGARMAANGPKQYLTVGGQPMLRHAVDAFRASPLVAHTYVVVSPDDGVIDSVLPPGLDGVTVLRAGGGGSLGKDEVGYAMRERLLPLSLIATPNLPEARILAELPEGTADECAEKLLPFIKHLLITGGHGDEHQVHNRLYSRDGTRQTFTCQRLPGSYHGSGCTLASALAGRIAQGEGLVSAVQSALNYTWRTLRDAEQLGQGQFVPRRLPLDFCS